MFESLFLFNNAINVVYFEKRGKKNGKEQISLIFPFCTPRGNRTPTSEDTGF